MRPRSAQGNFCKSQQSNLLRADTLRYQPLAIVLFDCIVVAADGGDVDVDVSLHHDHPGGGVARCFCILDYDAFVSVAVVHLQGRRIEA